MKKILALVLSMAMAISMVACGGSSEAEKTALDKIIEKGYITYAVSPDFAPSEFKNPETGEVLGTDIEVAKMVAAYLSEKYETTIELKIEEMDFKACQAAVASGAADFSLSGYALTDERAENYYCTVYYGMYDSDDSYQGVLVKAGEEYKTAEDFAGKKIGTQLASLQYNLAVEQLPADIEIEYITNLSQAALMVSTGKIDGLVTASSTGELLAANDPELAMAEFKFDYSSEGNVGLVNIDEPELGAAIDEALKYVNETVDFADLVQDYTDLASQLGVTNE